MSDDDITKYVGAATVAKMRSTRVHMFARAIGDVLYSCNTSAVKYETDGFWKAVKSTPETSDADRKFFCPLHVYVGDRIPKGQPFLAGHEDKYIDVRKMLGELMHELERLALNEVT